MALQDPRNQFISNIDLSKSRIGGFEGFIFLCGGSLEKWNSEPISARAILRKAIEDFQHSGLKRRLRLAEEITDWFEEEIFSDLVTFEAQLAALSSSIILIIESPGAIAELGSFAATDEIRERLYVVISELHYKKRSFIKLGPIKYLEHKNGKQSTVLNWVKVNHGQPYEEVSDLEDFRSHCNHILSDVSRDLDKNNESIFQRNLQRHIFILIIELCRIFSALTESEIREYLDALDIQIDAKTIRQYLFILTKTDLLIHKAFINERFYCAPNSKSFLSFRFKGNRIDIVRTATEVTQFYKNYDRLRFDALRSLISRYSE